MRITELFNILQSAKRVILGYQYGNILFILLLLILTSIHFYQKNLLAQSGDEPRFAYYAYSIAKGEMLKYPITKFVEETGSVTPAHVITSEPVRLNVFNKTTFMYNSIVPPLLYSPALFFGKESHLWQKFRTAAFLYYCGGLVFIWLSLKTLFSVKESLLALTITTLSLPQMAQMSLANTEQAAIFFLAASIYFLIFRKMSVLSILIGAVSMCLVVYCSMRSALLVGPVAIGFLARLSMAKADIGFNKRKGLFAFLACSAIGGLGWAVFQLSFTGTISGSSLLYVDPLVVKPTDWYLHRLFVPMFNHRDGIFLLFPLVFAALLGLVNASRRFNLVALVALTAWLSYYILISMTSQLEGYPGRLQFVLVEFFAIGLAFFIRDFKNIASTGMLILGAAVSLFFVYVHFSTYPTILIQNRQFGLFQQMILENTQLIDFGQYLIWDEYSVWTSPAIPIFASEAWNIAYKISFFLATLGLLLLASISERLNANIRKASSLCAVFVVLFGAFSLFVIPVQQKSVLITQDFVDSHRSVNLVFDKPIGSKATITFGSFRQQAFWYPPDFPSFFSVVVEMADGATMHFRKRSMPEMRLSVPGNIKSIAVSGDNANVAWNTFPVKIYVPLL